MEDRLAEVHTDHAFIYCGLNPGRNGDDTEFSVGPCSNHPLNVPFSCDRDLARLQKLPYWLNALNFFNRHLDIQKWFDNGVTSTFLSPWRTDGIHDILRLSPETKEELLRNSSILLKRMIDHHRAVVLVTAGVKSLDLLDELVQKGDVEVQLLRGQAEGPGNTYQWSQSQLRLQDRTIVVLQIPHFSRANSVTKMDQCAGWLRRRLEPFGLQTER